MFKKRNKAKNAASTTREQTKWESPPTSRPITPSAQPQYERTKLSVTELQQRYSNREEPQFEEIDDNWEDEQLRKNGVLVEKQPINPTIGTDPFRSVKNRVQARIEALKTELESISSDRSSI